MLRIAFLVLLLANAGYYAWSGGMLRGVGLGPEDPSEPQRLAQQIRPEILRLQPPAASASASSSSATAPTVAGSAATAAPAVPAAAASSVAAPAASSAASTAPVAAGAPVPPAQPASAAASAATAPIGPIAAGTTGLVCQQAGPFDQNQADTLRVALPAAGFAAGSWSLDFTPTSGRWMVYMGRFPDEDALARKRAELRARKVAYDRPGNPALEPGLSLGRYASQEAAERALATLAGQGVRTARVVQERTGTPSEYMLRLSLPAGDAQAARLDRLRPALMGRTLRACS